MGRWRARATPSRTESRGSARREALRPTICTFDMATSTCSRLVLVVGRQDERQRGLDHCGAAALCVCSDAGRASLAPAARSQPRRPPPRRARHAVARQPPRRRRRGRRRAAATPRSEPLRDASPTPHASSRSPRAPPRAAGPSQAPRRCASRSSFTPPRDAGDDVPRPAPASAGCDPRARARRAPSRSHRARARDGARRRAPAR